MSIIHNILTDLRKAKTEKEQRKTRNSEIEKRT